MSHLKYASSELKQPWKYVGVSSLPSLLLLVISKFINQSIIYTSRYFIYDNNKWFVQSQSQYLAYLVMAFVVIYTRTSQTKKHGRWCRYAWDLEYYYYEWRISVVHSIAYIAGGTCKNLYRWLYIFAMYVYLYRSDQNNLIPTKDWSLIKKKSNQF